MNTLLRGSGLALVLAAGLNSADRAVADELTCESPRSSVKICMPQPGCCCIGRWWASLAPPNAPIADSAAILRVGTPLQQISVQRDMRFSSSASTPGANFNAGAGSRCNQAAAAAPENNCANSGNAAAAAPDNDCSSSRRNAGAGAPAAGATNDAQVQQLEDKVNGLQSKLDKTTSDLGEIKALLQTLANQQKK